MSKTYATLGLAAVLAGCAVAESPPAPAMTDARQLGVFASGWTPEIVALVEQSHAGWDIEVGDTDGDGRPEILTGSAPGSRLYQFQKRDGAWQQRVLVDAAAGDGPGLLLGVRAVDLDGDGLTEIITGSGQEDGDIAEVRVLRAGAEDVTTMATLKSPENTSQYTHGLPTADLDGDGVQEILSSYCGNGEVIRYDLPRGMGEMHSRKVLQLSGSGEDVQIADVDGDGVKEMLVSNGFRDGRAAVQIHDFDPRTGDPKPTPRLVLDGVGARGAFYASLTVGDIDGDGRPELIVGWKLDQTTNRATILAYHVTGAQADVAYTLAVDDPDFDMSYFEKMMAIDDLDRDGRNELVISTRGDGASEGIPSDHLAKVHMFRIGTDGAVQRTLIADFGIDVAHSVWVEIADADGDGTKEVVLATGIGDRTDPGWSWVVLLHPPKDLGPRVTVPTTTI